MQIGRWGRTVLDEGRRVELGLVIPFLEATWEILGMEMGEEAKRGKLSLHPAITTVREVTALVALTGGVQGAALYGMSRKTALGIVSRVLGQPFAEFDTLAQSGIAELGNVITGRASALLARVGYATETAPPLLVIGSAVLLSPVGIPWLAMPYSTSCGEIEIRVALKRSPLGPTRPRRQVA